MTGEGLRDGRDGGTQVTTQRTGVGELRGRLRVVLTIAVEKIVHAPWG